MARIIKPLEIQAQANSAIDLLEKDEEILRDILAEIQSFSQTEELQGQAWSGAKAQIVAHDMVIRGFICIIDEMAEASTQLISLCGEEDLDEDLLVSQIKQLEETRDSYEEAIKTYSEWLRNDVYELCLGWYARERISDYKNAISSVDDQIRVAQEKLDMIDEIDNATRDLTSETEKLYDAVSQGMKYLESIWTGRGFTTSAIENLTWVSILNKAWDKNLKKEEGEKLDSIKGFLDALPEALKPYISADNLELTDDGFVMCTKSLADILMEMGIKDTNITNAVDDVKKYYDDWQLYAVKENDGKYTYSLLKMREQEEDKGDNDDPGITISFIKFDINALSDLGKKNGQTKANIDAFDAAVDKVVSDTDGAKHDDILQKYFAETKSDAPYLIVDKYIEKIANTSKDNKIVLPNLLNEDQQRVIEALNELNERAGQKIYDPDNNCLNIQDSSSLTAEEKYAILAAYTSNVTYNSFAAEVEFHSNALVDWRRNIPIIGKSYWYNSAIRADMAIGEEKESNVVAGFDDYYDLDSDMVQSQRDAHGNK